jgi:MFS family permease
MLWFGQIISLLGDWFNLIASASLLALLTGSGLAIGSLYVVRMLAPFLVSPIAGVVADRYNRKTILIATDISRAIAVLGFLLVRDSGQVWLLYVLTAIQLGISGFFFPTRNAILPDVVSQRELGAANALSSATWSVMLALGAALGGIVSGVWGIYTAFTIDALTFLISAYFIFQIRLDHRPGLAGAGKSIWSVYQQYLDGLRFLGRHRDVLVISLHKAVVVLMAGSTFEIIQIAIARDVFVIGIGGGIGLGLMFAVNGIGSGLGPIVARAYTGDRNRPLRLAITLGYLLIALGYVIVAPLFSFSSVLLGAIVRGCGGGIVWVFSTQLLLQLVPNQLRGRIFATEFAIFSVMGAVGAAMVGGLLDSTLTISGVIWLLAGLILTPAILWGLWIGLAKPVEVTS